MYFAAHALFAAAMLALVLADNLVFLYVAWELVGLGSFLLIGFWYERRSAAEAAKKAFITTRIGDVGLLIGIILLYRATDRSRFPPYSTWHSRVASNRELSPFRWRSSSLGAMGKSAQFPFHVWLPDAMEGPTPVSALIHAATMGAAGVYLVARLMPLFELAPLVLLGGWGGRPGDIPVRRHARAGDDGSQARAGLLHDQPPGADDAVAGRR